MMGKQVQEWRMHRNKAGLGGCENPNKNPSAKAR